MVFEELNVNVGADTGDFSAGMNRVNEGLDNVQREALLAASATDIMGDSIDDVTTDAFQAAGAMQLLGSRTDNAGDQMTQTAVQSAAASTGLTNLSTSGGLASSSMLSFSTVLTASVLPALAVVSAAAVPVVAALGGLVTVAGAIFGIGLIGAIGGIATAGRDLQVAFEVMVQLVRDELAPVFNAAQDVMISFIAAFEDVLPALVPAQSVIDELATLFDEFGTALINLLPAFAELGITLAREFLPGMIQLAEDVLPQVPDFIRSLVGVFERLIPSFERAGNLLVNLGPPLLEFGFTALNVVAPALDRVTTALIDGLQWFNSLDETVQQLTTRFASIAPVVAGLATLLGGPITIALAGVVASVTVFRDETEAAFESVISTGRRVFNRLNGEFGSTQRSLQTFGQIAMNALDGVIDFLGILQRVGTRAFEVVILPAINQLVNSLDGQLAPTITSLSNLIARWSIILREAGAALGQVFAENREEILTAGRLISDIIGIALVNAFDTLFTAVRVLSELFQGDLSQAFREVIGLGERVLGRFTEFVEDWGIVETFKSVLANIASTVGTFFTVTIPGQFISGLITLIGQAEVGLTSLENRFARAFNSIAQTVASIMTEIVNVTVVDSINDSISRIQGLISQLPSDLRGQLPSQLTNIQQLEDIQTPSVSPLETQAVSPSIERRQAAENLAARLDINIEGDGQLAQIIRENAQIEIQQQERRADRTRNRGSGV